MMAAEVGSGVTRKETLAISVVCNENRRKMAQSLPRRLR